MNQIANTVTNEILTSEQETKAIATVFDSLKTREDILNFSDYIENLPDSLGEDPFPLFHHFADGMYTREVHIPKGMTCVGKIHRNEYFVNVMKGHLIAVSEFGMQELKAPCSFKAKKGVKHIVYAIDDCVWSDTHSVNSDNVEDAEKEIFVKSYDELEEIVNDYDKAVEEIGYTDEQVEVMLKTDDLVDQPDDVIRIDDSEIQGKGVFAEKELSTGDEVIMLTGQNRTPAGRYMNHSNAPNVECAIKDDMIVAKILNDIDKDDELTVDYRQVYECSLEYREKALCQA